VHLLIEHTAGVEGVAAGMKSVRLGPPRAESSSHLQLAHGQLHWRLLTDGLQTVHYFVSSRLWGFDSDWQIGPPSRCYTRTFAQFDGSAVSVPDFRTYLGRRVFGVSSAELDMLS